MAETKLRRRDLLLGAAAAPAALRAQRPNLVLIVTDQQHIDSIAAHGNRWVRTPAMDHLCRNGLSYEQSHTTDPVCSPARSALFTGRPPSETGVYNNGRPIRDSIPNIGQWLSEKGGYEAIYAGKWHLPHTYSPKIPGFRVLPGGIGGQGEMGDTSVARACEAWLRHRRGADPFLMVASFLQPHDICEWLRLNMRQPDKPRRPELASEFPPLPDNFNYDPAEPEALRQRRAALEPAHGHWDHEHWRYYLWSYYRHIEMVDGEIGRILEALHDTGRERDTLVMLTADHGEGMGHHQTVRKHFPYDEALKVPLVISFPGEVPAGKTDARRLVNGLDVMPTLCGYAGIEPPPKTRGRNLRAPGVDEGFMVSEIPVNIGRVVRTQRYKYANFAGDPVEQLFDMQADPGETRNLARSSQHARVLADHKKLLLGWERRLEPVPDLPNGEAWRRG